MNKIVFAIIAISLTSCSQIKKYSDFNECLNEETKTGATVEIAKEYCRRFVKTMGDGIFNQSFKAEKQPDGKIFVHINGQKFFIERTATNLQTGERLGLVGENWIRIEIVSK
jgi:hypothetical protein